MKFQILFSRNWKKNIISLLSAQLAQRVVKVYALIAFFGIIRTRFLGYCFCHIFEYCLVTDNAEL